MRLRGSAVAGGLAATLIGVIVWGTGYVRHAGANKACSGWTTGTIDSVRIDGSDHTKLTDSEGALDSKPRFTPRGALVFSRDRSPSVFPPLDHDYFLEQGRLRLMDDVGRRVGEPPPYPPVPPTFASPDGRFEFVRQDDGNARVLLDRRTGTKTALRGDGISGPDGAAIWSSRRDAALVSGYNLDAGGDQGGQMYLIDLSSGEAHLLVRGSYWQRDFQFSPDGGTIVFSNVTKHLVCEEVPD